MPFLSEVAPATLSGLLFRDSRTRFYELLQAHLGLCGMTRFTPTFPSPRLEVIAALFSRHEQRLHRHPKILALELLDNSNTVRRLCRLHYVYHA